ncbi:molybdate ABC transporter substrate-binding protein [Prosthecobacter sp.]|uniref:molybdate ABC transporter substrate-binding protein n=1 Tax=Prosthecobacter sp. TaxID=1965333 RepID=UPI003784BBFD
MKRRHAALLLTCACIFSACRPASSPAGKTETSTLTIAVASSVQFAMEDVLKEFSSAHPEVTVKATYGSSGKFVAQIQNEAPFDVFLAADMEYADKLAKAGLALDGKVSPYAIGGLVLWVPKSSPLDVEKLGIAALNDPAVKKIAIANPKLAPYGVAAVAAMKSLKVYEQAEPKLVLGENISQTAQFTESGAADIGFLALSHAVSDKMKDKGRWWEVPADAFPAIEQGMVILKRTPNADAARTFRDFVLGEAGGKVLQRHGFKLPAK